MNEQNLFITKLYWVPLLLLLVFTSCKDSFNFEPSLESLTVEKMVNVSELYPGKDPSGLCISTMATKKGFICVGYYNSSQDNGYSNIVITWDNEGNRLGTNEFNSFTNSTSDLLTRIDKYIETSNGSIIALGLESDIFTVYKFNADGEFVWKNQLFDYNDYNIYSLSLFEGDNNYILLASDNNLQTSHSRFEILKDGSEVNEDITESDFRRFTVHRISNEKAIYVGVNNGSLSAIVKVVDINGNTIKEKEYPTTPLSGGVRLEKSRSYLLIDNQDHMYKTDNNLEIEWDTSLSGFNHISSAIVETKSGNFLYNTRDAIYLYSIEGDKLDEYASSANGYGLTKPVKLTNGNIVLASRDYETTQLVFFNTKQ